MIPRAWLPSGALNRHLGVDGEQLARDLFLQICAAEYAREDARSAPEMVEHAILLAHAFCVGITEFRP